MQKCIDLILNVNFDWKFFKNVFQISPENYKISMEKLFEILMADQLEGMIGLIALKYQTLD